jgi:hypothetical protein
MFFHREMEIASTTVVLGWLLHRRSQAMEDPTNNYVGGPQDTDGIGGLVDAEGLIGTGDHWTEALQ